MTFAHSQTHTHKHTLSITHFDSIHIQNFLSPVKTALPQRNAYRNVPLAIRSCTLSYCASSSTLMEVCPLKSFLSSGRLYRQSDKTADDPRPPLSLSHAASRWSWADQMPIIQAKLSGGTLSSREKKLKIFFGYSQTIRYDRLFSFSSAQSKKLGRYPLKLGRQRGLPPSN